MKQFETLKMIDGKKQKAIVDGYEVDNNAFVYKEKYGWFVVDKASGRTITRCRSTKKDAIKDYHERLELYNLAKTTDYYTKAVQEFSQM